MEERLVQCAALIELINLGTLSSIELSNEYPIFDTSYCAKKKGNDR